MNNKSKIILIILIIVCVVSLVLLAIINIKHDDSNFDEYITENNINIRDYYDEYYDGSDKKNNHTKDVNINYTIEEIKNKNSYKELVVLENYTDRILQGETYVVVYNDSDLYYITKLNNGQVYSKKGDYTLYKEIKYGTGIDS